MTDVDQVVSGVLGSVDQQNLTLHTVFRLAVLVVAGLLVIKLVMHLVDRLLRRSKLTGELHGYVRSGVRILLYVVLGLMVAGELDLNISSLIAMLSVAGLAVSLALQNTLSNLAGGIMLLTSKPFVIGDYIETDSGSGTVMSLGLAYTKLTTVENKVINIPNSIMSGAKIINYTTQGTRRAEFLFTASYDASQDTVKTALWEVLKEVPNVLQDPAPTVRVNAYKDSSIEYVVRAWATTEHYWNMYYDIIEGVRGAFERHGIEMTYNHLNVHLVENRCQ